jgi:hypothetical protein
MRVSSAGSCGGMSPLRIGGAAGSFSIHVQTRELPVRRVDISRHSF